MHEDNTSWQTHLNDWTTPPFFLIYLVFSFHPEAFAFYQSGEDSYSAVVSVWWKDFSLVSVPVVIILDWQTEELKGYSCWRGRGERVELIPRTTCSVNPHFESYSLKFW